MSKPIPKFLHEDLKKLIGKRNPTQDDVTKLLALVLTTHYNWTERVIQYVNVHYETSTNTSINDMLEENGDLDDLIEAWQENDIDRCISLIAIAIDNVEDELHDNRWDHGDEVDRDYLDEEFQDTVDVDYETFVSTRQQGQTSWMGDQVRYYEDRFTGQPHKFVWKNIVKWFANRRSTPMNDGPHRRFMDSRRNQQAELDEYGNAS